MLIVNLLVKSSMIFVMGTGYTPNKKLLNSSTPINNADSAPRWVPLKAFAEETPKRIQNSSVDSVIIDYFVVYTYIIFIISLFSGL